MKTQHFIIFLGVALAIGVGVWMSSRKKPHPLVGLTAIVPAIESYARDLSVRGQALPDSVTLSQLADGKFLDSDSVVALTDLDTPIAIVRVESDPSKVQVRIRLRDGSTVMQVANLSK